MGPFYDKWNKFLLSNDKTKKTVVSFLEAAVPAKQLI